MSKAPIRVAITGAAGQIGYSLLFRIASGAAFGPDQPVILHLIEIPDEKAMAALGGVCMELDDCAFPLLKGIVATASLDEGFKGVNWALLVGSVPRKQGMERKDLLGINGKIFTGQGNAIAKNAASDVRVLVVGNPCNTNSLIAMNNAPGVPGDRFFAMTMLDENRAKTQLAKKASVDVTAVTNLAIWGNHSATMYPDCVNTKINGRPGPEVIRHGATVDLRVEEIGIHRGAMIAPDGEVRNSGDVHARFFGELRLGAIFIKHRHGEETVAGHAGRVVHGDERIGVARIADDEHANVARGIFGDGTALTGENFSVDAKQILALHALL